MGIENAITAAEVAAADFVILTNDVKIRDVERFSGNRFITSVPMTQSENRRKLLKILLLNWELPEKTRTKV